MGPGMVRRSKLSAKRIKICELEALTEEHKRKWQDFRTQDVSLQTPFLSLGYLELCQRSGSDVRVCVISCDGEDVAFFPFEVIEKEVARPVGSYFNDYQGIVGRSTTPFSLKELLEKTWLGEIKLDHFLHAHMWGRQHAAVHDVSWLVELGSGHSEYLKTLTASQLRNARKIIDARRKLEDRYGSIEFRADFQSSELLEILMHWKSEQWSRAGWHGRFTAEWERRLMYDLMSQKNRDFSGIFSGVFLKGEPLALHLGLGSFNTWHYWTTGYDATSRFSKYSPGLIMLHEMIRSAPRMIYSRLDLGRGELKYKKDVANATQRVSEMTLSKVSKPRDNSDAG